MDERKARAQLKAAGADQIRSDRAKGAYDHTPELREIVDAWLSEQDAPVKEAREQESLLSSKEANSLAKDSNLIALEANRLALEANVLASRANTTAITAMVVAATALIIEAWPYINSIIENYL